MPSMQQFLTDEWAKGWIAAQVANMFNEWPELAEGTIDPAVMVPNYIFTGSPYPGPEEED